ncbi:MAG: hypothetical protein C0507_17445 [Cyanobacteria bacterium PR.3.49]|nr:hypothetical protein [Cyanobacteria bacterium PR.3.49]
MTIIKKVTGGMSLNGDKVVGVGLSRRSFQTFGALIACVTAYVATSPGVDAVNPAADVSKAVKPALKKSNDGPSMSGWKLDQRSRVLGDQTLYVCAAGVKTVNRKDGVTIMTAAPFDEVITFSTKTRKVCRKSFAFSDNPYARAVAMFSGVAHGQMPLKKVRDFKKGGLNWSEFKIPESYGESRKAMFKRKEVTSSEPSSGRVVVFHLPMEKRAIDWTARLFCVPKSGGIPFDVSFSDVDGDVHSLVKTFNMTAMKLSAADFKCPSGLRMVKDPRAVIQDESADDAIEMMMSRSEHDKK